VDGCHFHQNNIQLSRISGITITENMAGPQSRMKLGLHGKSICSTKIRADDCRKFANVSARACLRLSFGCPIFRAKNNQSSSRALEFGQRAAKECLGDLEWEICSSSIPLRACLNWSD